MDDMTEKGRRLQDRIHRLMWAFDRKAKMAKSQGESDLAVRFEDFAFQLQSALEETGTLYDSETVAYQERFGDQSSLPNTHPQVGGDTYEG